jgi:hypothetical protein
MKHKRQSLMSKNGDEKGGKSGSCTNDEDSMDMDGGSGKGGHASGSETGLDLDKSALSPDDSDHSQSSRDETVSCEKPTTSTPLSMIDPCCAADASNNRTSINATTTGSPSGMSPRCEDHKMSVSNTSLLLHSALSSISSSPATRNTMGSPSSISISPKGQQSPSEHINCATAIHSVTKARNWTPNTRQQSNTIECHSNHNNINPIINTCVNSSSTIPAQQQQQQQHPHLPQNGCNYYNRCISTSSSSSSPLSSSPTTSSTCGRRLPYSGQYSTTNQSRSSPSGLSQTTKFCYKTSPTDNFNTARTSQHSTATHEQQFASTTKFFSNPNGANGPNGSLYAHQQQSPQSGQQLQQRTPYFTSDYNCDYSGVRNESQTYPQRQSYDSAYMDNAQQQQQQYLANGTMAYANHVQDVNTYNSENNSAQQNNANAYTNVGYYELAPNSTDQNSYRIPSEYNAITLKQQTQGYSSQIQANAHQQQYYDVQSTIALATSPNIPSHTANTFDQTYNNSNSNNSSDITANCYNYNNSNYYDAYNNCTTGMTNNEFNFINIANEFASPEYYQLS